MRKPFIAGNWKMNKNIEESVSFVVELEKQLSSRPVEVDVLVAPSSLCLHACFQKNLSSVQLAGQNVHAQPSGAFTGECSASQLRSTGATHCLVGHSERRQGNHETDAVVKAKLNALLEQELLPILCLGENLEEREAGNTFNRIGLQLLNAIGHLSPEVMQQVTIAYEPIWAIGTGKTATPEQAQRAHEYLRFQLNRKFGEEVANRVRILYGGSVKPENIQELMKQEDIDGALVGGASLDLESFMKLIHFQ